MNLEGFKGGGEPVIVLAPAMLVAFASLFWFGLDLEADAILFKYLGLNNLGWPFWIWIILGVVLLEIIFIILLICNKKPATTSWKQHVLAGKWFALIIELILIGWVVPIGFAIWYFFRGYWKGILMSIGIIVFIMIVLIAWYYLNIGLAKLIGNEAKSRQRKKRYKK